MARRKRPDEKPNSYGFVFDKITKIEHDLVAHTVKAPFTVMDVVRMLLPEDKIAFLRCSFDLLDMGHYMPTSYTHTHELPEFGSVNFYLNTSNHGVAVWKPEATELNVEAPVYPAFCQTLREMQKILEQWSKVRAVVRYFDDCNASAGAVRYYWPAMGIFLGPSHPFHTLKGTTAFKEPADPAPMLELFRETAGVVSMAKFLPENIERKTDLQIGIPGRLIGII